MTFLDTYDRLRTKWKDVLAGGVEVDIADPDIRRITERLTLTAESAWANLQRSAQRDFLWGDLADPCSSAAITANYARIGQLALACCTHGSRLHQSPELISDIVSALDWMHSNRYHAGKTMLGNWWDWCIGAPLRLLDTMVLMYEHLSPEQRSAYIRAVDHFRPEVTPSSTGANRVWDCAIIALRGVLGKNGEKIVSARDGLSPVFQYVERGDGFYRDGSFVQHEVFAYTGGYGQSLLQELVNVLYLLHDSEWQVTAEERNHVFRWIYDAYEPLMYKGAMMDMAMGRVISRRLEQNHDIGHIIVRSLIRLSQIAPPTDAQAFKATAKEWIRSDTHMNFYSDASVSTAVLAKSIMNDKRIVPKGEMRFTKLFAIMARAVHVRQGFAFGISMHSSRIANYETINRENLRGWHTGDGMTYLYDADSGHYCDAFWPTVNSYRLPGTTVERNTETAGNAVSDEPWAGGTELLGIYGAAGMALHPAGSTLHCRKSWFLFEEEVVCLGSDIGSEGTEMVETVVENRQIGNDRDEFLTVNGTVRRTAPGWSEAMGSVDWIHSQGRVPGSAIGFIFPEGATVHGVCESRTDAWCSINRLDNDSTRFTRSYINLWLEHGIRPTAASYFYILLPNKSATEVSEYASDSPIELLANSAEVHAVRHRELNITGMIVWTGGIREIGGIRVSGPSSLMVREAGNRLDVAVSDPTFGEETIRIEIERGAGRVLQCDPGLEIVRLHTTIQLKAQVRNANGKTLQASFELSVR